MRVCKQRDILGMDFKDHISSPGDIWTPISRLKSVTDIRPSYRHSGEQEKKTIFYYMFPLPYDQKKKKLIIPFLVDFVLPDSWHAGKRSRFPHKKDFFEPVSPSYGSKINPNIYIWWIRFYILSNIIQETLGNVSIGMVLIKRCFVYDSSREKKKKKKKNWIREMSQSTIDLELTFEILFFLLFLQPVLSLASSLLLKKIIQTDDCIWT